MIVNKRFASWKNYIINYFTLFKVMYVMNCNVLEIEILPDGCLNRLRLDSIWADLGKLESNLSDGGIKTPLSKLLIIGKFECTFSHLI